MMRSMLAVLVGLMVVPAASAQNAGRFVWQRGQTFVYQIEQATSASETVDGKAVETWAKLRHVKRWQVLEVDGAGVATLRMSLKALRIETRTPSGEMLLFDSTQPDKSTPELREQLGKFVETPLALLRMDAQGRVVEVKESKHGPASRFESELPFALSLPAAGLTAKGQAWERAYQITLEPPQGVGEKYDAVQKYVCQEIADGKATIRLTTALKNPPEAEADQIPLFQMQPEGEVVFDLTTGRLQSASLKVEREIMDHQGTGSQYRFKSSYTEQYLGDR